MSFVSEVDYLAVGCIAVDFAIATYIDPSIPGSCLSELIPMAMVTPSLLRRGEITPSKNLLVLLAALLRAIWLLIEPDITWMVSLSIGCEGGIAIVNGMTLSLTINATTKRRNGQRGGITGAVNHHRDVF